jgi:hypothetical protein
MNNSERVRFINTPLQRGVRRHAKNGTASAVLSYRAQTAEAVYVLSAQPALVAQICNLPYRRFVIGRASESSNAPGLADMQQNAILRYSAERQSRNQSSADFQVCCVADFQIRSRSVFPRAADLEVGDTAGLETCATASLGACRKSSRLATIFTDTDRLQICATINTYQLARGALTLLRVHHEKNR